MILRKKEAQGNPHSDRKSERLPIYKSPFRWIRSLVCLSVMVLVLVDLFGLPYVRIDDSNRYWSVTGYRDVQGFSLGRSGTQETHSRVILLPLNPPLTAYASDAIRHVWQIAQRNMNQSNGR